VYGAASGKNSSAGERSKEKSILRREPLKETHRTRFWGPERMKGEKGGHLYLGKKKKGCNRGETKVASVTERTVEEDSASGQSRRLIPSEKSRKKRGEEGVFSDGKKALGEKRGVNHYSGGERGGKMFLF